MTAHAQLWLGAPPRWFEVFKSDPRAAALADRHYSRQAVGDPQFMPPGETLVLLHEGPAGLALWGACFNLDPAGAPRWRCTIFRNESGTRSSELIREATDVSRFIWSSGTRKPAWVRLTTEVDPAQVRRKRDPGRCFLRAGWRRVGVRPAGHGRPMLVIFEAPL